MAYYLLMQGFLCRTDQRIRLQNNWPVPQDACGPEHLTSHLAHPQFHEHFESHLDCKKQ